MISHHPNQKYSKYTERVCMIHPTILSSLQMYQNNLESFWTKMCSVCMLAVQTSSSIIGGKGILSGDLRSYCNSL